MTQEEKALAYDEALERMKSWVRGEHPECFTEAQKAAEFIFPELKESKDEKIKREILELVSIAGNGNQFEEIKDWLEKQIEKKTIINPKFRVDDEIREALIKAFKEYPKNAVKYWHDIVIEDIITWLVKQGEQRYLTGVDLGDPAGDKGCIFNYSDATIPQKDFTPIESK